MPPTTPTSPSHRGHIATEQRHRGTFDLDQRDCASVVALMIDDHRAVIGALQSASDDLTALIEAIVERVGERDGRLIYVGAGTSGRLGVLDAAECPPTFQSNPQQVIGVIAGGDTALRRSSEGLEDDPRGAEAELDALKLEPRDTVLGIAAGGTTPYVLGAIELAARRRCLTGLLTCAPQAIAPLSCDHLVTLQTGPEVLTGSTRLKAGSATKLALNIITTALFTRLGKVYENLMVDLRASNDKLLDRAMRTLQFFDQELTRDDAAALLERADGQVKPAIVMHALGVDKGKADRMLATHGGRLRLVLDCAHDAADQLF